MVKTGGIYLLLLFVGVLLGMMLMKSCQNPQIERVVIEKTDTLRVEKVDTLLIEKPVPYKVEVHDTMYLDKTYNGHVFMHETKWFGDNETYDMQVSGINVQLDWIKTYPKTVTQYINTTETIYVPPKKWDVGIQAGVGITPKGLQPYLGFGISRRLEF